MYLVKEITTSRIFIEIYSINQNLIVAADELSFEGKDDQQIQDIVFNQIGAEEVRIYDVENRSNSRSYAIA